LSCGSKVSDLGGRPPGLPLAGFSVSDYISGMVVRKRLELTGPAVAFVTTTIVDWLPLFSLEKPSVIAIEEFRTTLEVYRVSVFGYVLMPSHLHAILSFAEIQQLSGFVQCFKSVSSRRIKQIDLSLYQAFFWREGKFRLWKPRFDDFIIRDKEQFEMKLNYIHENPVRAGLVTEAIDYKYSSARTWQLGETGPIEIQTDIGFW